MEAENLFGALLTCAVILLTVGVMRQARHSLSQASFAAGCLLQRGHTMQLARIKKIVKCYVGEIVDNGGRMSSGEVHMVFSKLITEFTCCVCTVHNTDDFLIHVVTVDNACGFGGHYDGGKRGELRITSMRTVTKSAKY